MNRTIGIVGGVGSYAGIDLIKKIYDQTKVAKDQDHLPVIMISIPHAIPDRTDYLTGQIHTNPGIAIAKIIKMLADTGAKIIGISCNAVHSPAIFDYIYQQFNEEIEIVHMIDEVAHYIKNHFPKIKKVGILSTTGTQNANIYPDLFKNQDIEAIQVTKDIQENFVQPAIYDEKYGIKAVANPVSEKAIENLKIATSYLIEKGVEAIILGCTEIPLAIPEKIINKIPIIDATNVLARSLIMRSAPEKFKSDL